MRRLTEGAGLFSDGFTSSRPWLRNLAVPPQSCLISGCMRKLILLLVSFVGLSALSLDGAPEPGADAGQKEPFRVLVFSYTTGFRHDSIPNGIAAVEKLGREHGFSVDKTEDPGEFTGENLSRYQVVIFMNTNGTLFNDEQREALKSYIRNGGGYAGVHSAAATEYDWDWYRRLVGAHFRNHPKVQPAAIRVEDCCHVSTRHLPDPWERTDEWYNFRTNPRADVRVLLSLDTGSMEGSGMKDDHPLAWCQEFDGGRSWYTALGHTNESYEEAHFVEHLRGGIFWAAGVAADPVP